MMKQYREARESLEDDTLLLFRLGDFYEMFERDAERGAALLGITLTKRHDMPMAGIPSHAAEGYLTKLLEVGEQGGPVRSARTTDAGKVGQARHYPHPYPRNRLGGWAAGWIQQSFSALLRIGWQGRPGGLA